MTSFFGILHPGFFCLAVLLLNATPGPDTAYIVGRSVAQGRLAGIVSAGGISLGCCVHAMASALGLSALLSTSATAFLVIKVAGGVYLIYLGLRLLLASSPDKLVDGPVRSARPLQTIFWQGFLTNVLNPKVILFFLSFFPQFVAPEAMHKTASFLLLGAIFVLMSTCWNCGTAVIAGNLAQRFNNGNRYQRWLERGVGSAFIALGTRLALMKN